MYDIVRVCLSACLTLAYSLSTGELFENCTEHSLYNITELNLTALRAITCFKTAFSRRRRTYNRVRKTDLGTYDFLLSEVTLILVNFEIFEFFLSENRCESIDSEATIGPVVAPWIVWKTLKKKVACQEVWSAKNEFC